MNSCFIRCLSLAYVSCYFKESRGHSLLKRSLKCLTQKRVPGLLGTRSGLEQVSGKVTLWLGRDLLEGRWWVSESGRNETEMQVTTAELMEP